MGGGGGGSKNVIWGQTLNHTIPCQVMPGDAR